MLLYYMHRGSQRFDLLVVEHTEDIWGTAECIEIVSYRKPCPVRRFCELYLARHNIDQLSKFCSHRRPQRGKAAINQPSFVVPLHPSSQALSSKYSDESARCRNKRRIDRCVRHHHTPLDSLCWSPHRGISA